ncbi:MAG: spore coat protein CotJB [Oscillospiraceae bacterium]|nr:spore coat protein CotJB [Oscillospiraceae bacterium]
MDRDRLLKEFTELAFMAFDLRLFLNTHPNNMEALEKFNETSSAAKIARASFEKKYGPLSPGSEPMQKWNWIDNPWPWENKANFNFDKGDER